ncbi:hypothetical protein ACFQHX_01435, partial [Streptococcus loxodontisalivarius]
MMTYIDELLKEHCPNGVEWKELGEVCEFIRGNGLQKKDFVEKGYPVIHYGQIYTYYGRYADTTKSYVNEETFIKLKKHTKISSEEISDGREYSLLFL